MINDIYSDQAPKPLGPYSQAVRYKDIVFVSGQIAIDPKTALLVNGSIEEQTFVIFNNISTILREVKMSLTNIIKVDIFLDSLSDFEKFNQAYKNIFTDPVKPARCVAEVSRLPGDAKLEISCVAGADL